MHVVAEWYASGTFWAGAGTVVAILAAVAVVWVTLMVGFPRRRLFYQMQAVAPLMIAPESMRHDLELRHCGELLADPRALTIKVVSRGLKDIPSDAFNEGQPLQLNVGALVVRILQVTSQPASLPTPQVAMDGTSVMIGPSLIGRRHTITITVLTDGGKPALTCQSPIVDVQVRQRSGEPPSAMRVAATSVAALAAAAGSAAAGMAAASLPTTAGLTVMAGVVVVAAIGIMAALWRGG